MDDAPVVNIGRTQIDRSTVRHWARALELDGPVLPAQDPEGRGRIRQALDFLISSNWLIGEAAREGAMIGKDAVDRGVAQLRESIPGGAQAFAASLEGERRTLRDVEFEIRVKLATAAIRGVLAKNYGHVSEMTIRRNYKVHKARYRIPEYRQIDIVEHLPSAAAARRLAARLGTGSAFAAQAYDETRRRPRTFDLSTEKGRLERAIFRAGAGVLVGPLKLADAWVLFVVRRVQAPTVRPLASVRETIAQELSGRTRAREAKVFFDRYRRRWRAITRCRPGYVTSLCSEYRGAPLPESNPFAGI
jgi:hypothetical protein